MYHLHRLHYDDYAKSSAETSSYRKEMFPYLFLKKKIPKKGVRRTLRWQTTSLLFGMTGHTQMRLSFPILVMSTVRHGKIWEHAITHVMRVYAFCLEEIDPNFGSKALVTLRKNWNIIFISHKMNIFSKKLRKVLYLVHISKSFN